MKRCSCGKKADAIDKDIFYCARCWIKYRYIWFKNSYKTNKDYSTKLNAVKP